jgi:filamin
VTDGCDASRVKAYGPGLERGTTSNPAKFTVDTRGAGTGGLGLAIEGPSDAKIRCEDNKDGTCSVEYFPEQPGEYDVIITYGGDHVQGSPFSVQVSDKVDPTKVKISGDGVKSGMVRSNVASDFTIDCSQAGVAPLETTVRGPSGHVRVEVTEKSSQVYTAKYISQEIGHHEVSVKYAGQHVTGSPCKVGVLPQYEANKVKATGAGLDNKVKNK